jgi:hypothetical protein
MNICLTMSGNITTYGRHVRVNWAPHNIGNNSSQKGEVTESNFYDTSNSDPSNSATMSNDGRIPKIISDPN